MRDEAQDTKTIAAVMAAVQAFLDQEASVASSTAPRRLSPWKTAPWHMLAGGGWLAHTSWKRSA